MKASPQSLQKYQKMRDFQKTAEPSGKRTPAVDQPIFVVQLHHATRRHYDFRLQVGDVLKSWAVPKGPSFDPTVKRLAVEVEDHPLEYAGFEGTIPAGNYGAGDVRIFDTGPWSVAAGSKGDAEQQIRDGHVHVSLFGAKLRGDWDLIRTRGRGGKPEWLLKKKDDDEAGLFESDDLLGDPEDEPPKTRVWHSNRGANRDTAPTVRLTSPERVIYPEMGITKAEVFAYYHGVAPHLLPQIALRPLALVRCPKGTGGTCFFQKHLMPGWGPHVHPVSIPDSDGTIQKDIYIEDEEGLLELAQMNVLELHAWGAKIDDPELCDRLVFDLDPAPGLDWKRVIAAARTVRDLLDSVELESFVRLSGGKGLHVVAPIIPAPWDEAKRFTQHVAGVLATGRPNEFVDVMTKARRTDKIFVDYLRNGRGATSVVSYSLRRNDKAGVAMPVDWNELGRVDGPQAFDLRNTIGKLGRRARDPWERIDKLKQRLPALNRE